MRSALAGLLVSLTILSAPAAGQAGTIAYQAGSEQQVLTLLNQIRQQRGLARLTFSLPLRTAARAHSVDMLQNAYFDHDSPGESSDVRIGRYLPSTLTGETIARGVGLYGSPAGLVGQWMRSPGHRAVILAPAMRRVGLGILIGAFSGTRNMVMATADFTA